MDVNRAIAIKMSLLASRIPADSCRPSCMTVNNHFFPQPCDLNCLSLVPYKMLPGRSFLAAEFRSHHPFCCKQISEMRMIPVKRHAHRHTHTPKRYCILGFSCVVVSSIVSSFQPLIWARLPIVDSYFPDGSKVEITNTMTN